MPFNYTGYCLTLAFAWLLLKEHYRAGEERSRWEKELAEAEVDAIMLQQEIRSRKERLQELKKHSSDTITLQAQVLSPPELMPHLSQMSVQQNY